MFRKLIAAALIVMSLFALCIPASMAESRTARTMYVNTANGGPLNVRTAPDDSKDNVICQYSYGDAVTVRGIAKNGWYEISCPRAKTGTGYVMAKFLSATKISDEDIQKKEIERQMNHYHPVASFVIAARPTNPATGWVNFRSAPGTGASRIATLKDGRLLTVIGETLDRYKAVDSVTGMTCCVMKAYAARV